MNPSIMINASVWKEGLEPVPLKWQDRTSLDLIRQAVIEQLDTYGYDYGLICVPSQLNQDDREFCLFFAAFTDEFRGRQIVSGISKEHVEEALAEQKKFCLKKVFSPAELYALTPIKVSTDICTLVSVHLKNEIDQYSLDWDLLEKIKLAEIRTLADVNYDGRRTWVLETVWFKGTPVAVVNSSGRDGDEYTNRWITDPMAFEQMLSAIRACTASGDNEELVDSQTVLPEMTEFYNHTLHDYYDVATQTKKDMAVA